MTADINSMVAMAEYGITENTSLGFVWRRRYEIDLKTLNRNQHHLTEKTPMREHM